MSTAAVDQLLALELPPNDSGATTVRGYLVELLAELWRTEDLFSGKRPFGNSGWQYDLYTPMVKAGLTPGHLDIDGYVEDMDTAEADALITAAIYSLGEPK